MRISDWSSDVCSSDLSPSREGPFGRWALLEIGKACPRQASKTDPPRRDDCEGFGPELLVSHRSKRIGSRLSRAMLQPPSTEAARPNPIGSIMPIRSYMCIYTFMPVNRYRQGRRNGTDPAEKETPPEQAPRRGQGSGRRHYKEKRDEPRSRNRSEEHTSELQT